MFKFGKRKEREKQIARLRKELAEYLDNAAYHYCVGNCQGYNESVKMAIKANQKIKCLRA